MDARFCLIGKSLPHTLSPEIHAAFGRRAYDVVELADDEALAEFVKGRKYAGYNVTMPYKQTVIPLLDEVSPLARDIGAVNTVVDIGGKLTGDNTDAAGMKFALENAQIALKHKNVMILGSGGTSRTARYVAESEGAQSVRIASRTGPLNYENCYDLKDVDVILNTTPVGMFPQAYAKPLEISRFPNLEAVFDAVYNPLETLLVAEARALGLKAANGFDMLVEQARLAHNLFCEVGGGEKQPRQKSLSVCAHLVRQRRNIVLVGMAGAGKTTVGKAIAEALSREFLDTDAQIVRDEGKSVNYIFAKEGEAKFREYERAAVKKCCLEQGKVIATGGGAVLDEENRFYMRANGFVVHIVRDLDKVATIGRPLSTNSGRVRQLFESRKPLYESVADVEARNDSDIASVVESVLKEFER